MSYGDFTLSKVIKQFQLTLSERTDLFADVAEIAPSQRLREELDEGVPVALTLATEKVRSELIIAPVLMEARRLRDRRVGIFSGVEFTVDAAQGLSGTCDFLLSRSAEMLFVKAPVLVVVEAKNEDFRKGFAQCAAELVAAQIFNRQEGTEVPVLYGAVTTGNIWRFLQLTDGALQVDQREYYIQHVGKILGILVKLLS